MTATAPGKAILVGEHAVVYGRPAIAVPLQQTLATARVEPGAAGAGLVIYAQDIAQELRLSDLAAPDAPPSPMPPSAMPLDAAAPLLLVARQTLSWLGLERAPDWRVTLHSQIPMASGLGSGAAICAALVKGLWRMAAALDAGLPPLEPARISQIVYAAEEIYHGAPSGIDNTVVAYDKPVWFRKGEPPQILAAPQAFRLVVADSGEPGSTRTTVAHVRMLWQADRARVEGIFTAIEALVVRARAALEQGRPDSLGPIFDANHQLLQALEVSTPTLDRLVRTAQAAGAQGAKLSGGGGGGNIIAIVARATEVEVIAALQAAGARRVIVTDVGRNDSGA